MAGDDQLCSPKFAERHVATFPGGKKPHFLETFNINHQRQSKLRERTNRRGRRVCEPSQPVDARLLTRGATSEWKGPPSLSTYPTPPPPSDTAAAERKVRRAGGNPRPRPGRLTATEREGGFGAQTVGERVLAGRAQHQQRPPGQGSLP